MMDSSELDRMVAGWISYNIRFKCTLPQLYTVRISKPDGSAFTDEEVTEMQSWLDEPE